MNREKVFQCLADLDDRFVEESRTYAPGKASGAPERILHMKKKRFITLALAAALILSLGATAYAVSAAVSSPQAAREVAREEIELWKEMGILSPELSLTEDYGTVFREEESQGDASWYNRLFPRRYIVQWMAHEKYGGIIQVDTQSGKILCAEIIARPDEGDEPEEIVYRWLRDPDDPDKGYETEVSYCYENFDDLFPADMTIDRFCSLLAEYWGFSGYRIADTDAFFYDEYWEAFDGSTRLVDLPKRNPSNFYLTVFFEGEQTGAPMYIELINFPDYVSISIGTGHAVG